MVAHPPPVVAAAEFYATTSTGLDVLGWLTTEWRTLDAVITAVVSGVAEGGTP